MLCIRQTVVDFGTILSAVSVSVPFVDFLVSKNTSLIFQMINPMQSLECESAVYGALVPPH